MISKPTSAKALRDRLTSMTRSLIGKPSLDGQSQQSEARLANAVHRFYIEESRHSKTEFEELFLPLIKWYRRQLCTRMELEAEVDHTAVLIQELTGAVKRRRSLRLPRGRRDVDYRLVYSPYTYALVTAMIVDAYSALTQSDERPEDVLIDMLPPAGLERLRKQAIVWEDWLGYFQRSERGGLYAVAKDRWNTCGDQGEGNRIPQKPSSKAKPSMLDRAKAAVAESDTENGGATSNSFAGDRVLIALKACLEDGSLAYNNPGAFVNADRHGRVHLRSPEVFAELAKLYGWNETPQQLKNRFLRLKIHQVSPAGNSLFYGRSKRGKTKWRAGHVLKDGTLIWPEKTIKGSFRVDCPLAD